MDLAVIEIAGIGILSSVIAYEIMRAWKKTNTGKDTPSFPFLTGGSRYAIVLAMSNNIGKDNCNSDSNEK